MKRVPRLLLFVAAPVLVLPAVWFLHDHLRPCRPTEPIDADAPPATPSQPPLGGCFMGSPPPIEPVMVHDLGLLLPADAARLDGQRLRFRVQTAGGPDRRKVGGVYRDEYEVLPQGDPQGILQLEPGPDAKGFVLVEATLRVIHHPRIVVGAVDVKAFVEYRLENAVRP